jgi:hypothetical protein
MIPARTHAPVPAVQGISTAQLLALLRHPVGTTAAEVASEIQALHRLVESLPLTVAESCVAHNWLTRAQDLWEAGDVNAAHDQVTVVARKLGLLR